MIFSLSENGDLSYDSENKTFSNIILSDLEETEIKTARTGIIYYFKYKNIFKDEFVLHKRNIITDAEIKAFVDKHIEICFKNYPNIMNRLKYIYLNEGKKFEIAFYYDNGIEKINVVKYDMEI
ncbi:hypothetical protein [Cetobacterium sp.]|uniref:hypothetical protein n=1 Tax=Cetobacterium sp. TaxID=2071632 RepID=UPI003F3DD2BD